MNPEIKARWVADLRSGNFTQGTSRLTRDTDPDDVERDCCLGVLCKQAVTAGIVTRVDGYYVSTASPADKATAILPVAVMAWAGVDGTDPTVTVDGGAVRTLSEINDGGTPFDAIADLIEARL
jgi:hypothetical protein